MMNGENFVRLMTDRDIKISVDAHSHIILSGDDEAVTCLLRCYVCLFQEVLRLIASAVSEPIASTEQAITCVEQFIKDKPERPENFSALSLDDYYHELENACISYKIINGHVELTGGSKKSLPRCQKILMENPELEKQIILREIEARKLKPCSMKEFADDVVWNSDSLRHTSDSGLFYDNFFDVARAIFWAKIIGYSLTEPEARKYLNNFCGRGLMEMTGNKYRRLVILNCNFEHGDKVIRTKYTDEIQAAQCWTVDELYKGLW